MVSFIKETSGTAVEANPVLIAKETSEVTQSDKMFRIFSRPQIDMDDMMKFDKVRDYVAEHDLDQEILEQAEIQVKDGVP